MMRKLFILVSSVMVLVAPIAAAQESFTLEVVPPLFRVSVTPGGEWNSQLKILNPNPYVVTVIPRVVDYEPYDDRPGGELLTRRDTRGAERFSASHWTTIPTDAISIPAESTYTLPLALLLPEDAEPGTHTAAIVIGNMVGGLNESGSSISTSVTSLLVVTVLGEADVSGEITAFTTGDTTYPTTEADFTLEFKNTGEVHVEPRGEIVINNLWGVERGRVPVALDEELRLVLPNEQKLFRFVWRGEAGFFDVGPYRAKVRVIYGGENEVGDIQEATASLWFWVVPWSQMLIVSVGLLLFALLLVLGIRTVVIRILLREGMAHRAQPFGSLPPSAVGAVRSAVVDLRNKEAGTQATPAPASLMMGKKKAGPVFKVAFGLASIFALGTVVLYVMSAATRDTAFTVGLPEQEGIRVVGQDELSGLSQDVPQAGSEILAEPPEEEAEVAIEVRILVQNGSGIPGKAAEVSARLRDAGFSTVTSENADSFDYGRTVIRYKQGRGAIVEEIRDLLGLDPIIEEKEDLLEEVVLIVGQDVR